MPEGDTLHRTATTLQEFLGGRKIDWWRSSLPGLREVDLVGRAVTRVEARGKNLLIHFEGGRVLYTHLRMTGAWHVYRRGEAWRKPADRARVVIGARERLAVCFNAPVVELLRGDDLARHPVLAKLGPDLIDPGFDVDEAVSRLRGAPDRAIGEALLDQRSLAGIGNVYKSETLFLCGLHPAATVDELSVEELTRLVRRARDLMLGNLGGFPRVTRPGRGVARHWVYGRGGRPCQRCGTRIRVLRQGDAGRSTYWCPSCQSTRQGR